MLDVKQAAYTASNFLVGLYPQQSPADVRLEEVELTDDGKYWLITLSFPINMLSAMSVANREYKIFKVDANTGQVKSMKIREI